MYCWNISIIYFSGTGNTEVVASLIEAGLNETNDVDVYKVEDILLGRVEFDIHKYDLVGFGYPIYGFNAPSIIYDFIKRYKNMNNLNTFIFSTCAGPLYLNDIASFGFKNKLRIRGFSVIYERQFYMPANILTKYDDRLVKQLYNKAVLMVEEMVSEVKFGTNMRASGEYREMIAKVLIRRCIEELPSSSDVSPSKGETK